MIAPLAMLGGSALLEWWKRRNQQAREEDYREHESNLQDTRLGFDAEQFDWLYGSDTAGQYSDDDMMMDTALADNPRIATSDEGHIGFTRPKGSPILGMAQPRGEENLAMDLIFDGEEEDEEEERVRARRRGMY